MELTVTLMLSGVISGALAVSTVEQGSVSVPPWLSVTVVLTSPVGIVTGEVTDTHAGSSGVRVTEIPGDGAATGEPPLSR